MTLLGLLHTHIQQSGLIKLKAFLVLLLVGTLCGCSRDWIGGDGRGDWTLSLCEGYAITRINSQQILFVCKENANDSGSKIVIPNYFVTAYQLSESYICLQGIHTKSSAISIEEVSAGLPTYYFVDVHDDEIIGPFATQNDLTNYMDSLNLISAKDWIMTQ